MQQNLRNKTGNNYFFSRCIGPFVKIFGNFASKSSSSFRPVGRKHLKCTFSCLFSRTLDVCVCRFQSQSTSFKAIFSNWAFSQSVRPILPNHDFTHWHRTSDSLFKYHQKPDLRNIVFQKPRQYFDKACLCVIDCVVKRGYKSDACFVN